MTHRVETQKSKYVLDYHSQEKEFFVKVCFDQQDLSTGLAIVGHAIANRSTLPVLATIKVTTERERVRLEATNLEISVRCWVKAVIEKEGSITIPAKLLTNFVNLIPHHTITIATASGDTHRIALSSELSSATVHGMDPAEFPLWPTVDASEPPLVLEATTLKEMITNVAFAASADDSRPTLTGICLQVRDDQIVCVAADSCRVAVHTEILPDGNVHEPMELIVPAKTLKDVAGILPAQEQVEIHITPTKNQVLFHTEGVEVASRLMEGEYPNFRQMLPAGYRSRAVLETRLFVPIVKTAALFASESTRCISFVFNPGAGNVTVEAESEDIGNNTSVVPASYSDSIDQMNILFNVRYVSEVLSALASTPEIAIEMGTSARPGSFRPVGKKDVIYVVMPLQLKNDRRHPVAANAS